MPAVFAFLIGLALVAFLIAFGGNKALEALGINVDVPGGYVTSTLIVMVLLYLPVVIVTALQESRARREDPDSLLAQDTRTLNELARRNAAAAQALHTPANHPYTEPLPTLDPWPIFAIQQRLDGDAREPLPTSQVSHAAVQAFLDRVVTQGKNRPIETLALTTPPDLKRTLVEIGAQCRSEFDQLNIRAMRGTLVHFQGQAAEASRDYRAERVADVFRRGMGIPVEAQQASRTLVSEGDDLVLLGQLRALAAWAEVNNDPSLLAQRMLPFALVSGAWVVSTQRATLA